MHCGVRPSFQWALVVRGGRRSVWNTGRHDVVEGWSNPHNVGEGVIISSQRGDATRELPDTLIVLLVLFNVSGGGASVVS